MNIRFTITSPDAQGRIDPPVARIFNLLKNFNGSQNVTIVPVTRLHDFRFNLYLKEPWVLVDFSEFGWDWKQETSYLWGADRLDHEWFKGDEWRRLDDFIVAHPPVLTFQRELLAKDAAFNILPIEYPNYSTPAEVDSRAEFLARPIDVMFNWGRSHESRPRLHGDIFRKSGQFGYSIASQWDHIERQLKDENSGGLWCAIHTPHFARLDLREAIKWFGKSKIVIAMNGCGVKTFRHGEIPDAIMATPMDSLAWSVPLNSFAITEEAEVEFLVQCLHEDSLYEHYLNAVQLQDRIRERRYLSEYLITKIEAAL